MKKEYPKYIKVFCAFCGLDICHSMDNTEPRFGYNWCKLCGDRGPLNTIYNSRTGKKK